MIFTRIFSISLTSTEAVKKPANAMLKEGMIQNESGADVYIATSANLDLVQRVVLHSGNVYIYKSTDEFYLWASGNAVVVVNEECQE